MAHWLEHVQEYDSEVQHRPTIQTICLNDLGEITVECLLPAKSEVGMVTSRAPPDHKDNEKDLWSSENVAQAQHKDPDIGPVVDQLLREWNKQTNGELRPLSQATSEIWAQWELL